MIVSAKCSERNAQSEKEANETPTTEGQTSQVKKIFKKRKWISDRVLSRQRIQHVLAM